MFKILGKIDIANNLVISYGHEDLESFRSYVETKSCDFCHSSRERLSLFIVEIEGVRKVAGTSCLKKMFGIEAYNHAYHEAMISWSLANKNCWNLREAINKAYTLIETHGFVSNKEARSNPSKKSTFELLEKAYWEIKTTEDVSDKVIQFFNESADNNSYMLNCKAIIGKDWIDDACLRFIPSMVNSWLRQQTYLKMKEENCQATEYFGEVGERVKSETKASFVKEVYQGNAYAGYHLEVNYTKFYFKFGKSILCWRTSKNVSFEENQEVTFKAFTIKSQFESKFGKVTEITRPRF